MFRQYKNERIYQNLKVIYVLSIISVIWTSLALISGIRLFISYGGDLLGLGVYHFLLSYIAPIVTSIFELSYASKHRHIDYNPGATKWAESESNNDVVSQRWFWTYPILGLSCSSFVVLSFGWLAWATIAGEFLGVSIFLCLASFCWIDNCILIKREWANDPPVWLQEKWKEKAAKQREKEDAQKKVEKEKSLQHCNKLLQVCGMRFFIKYYRQIKSLPLRDVRVIEDYSYNEKEERLEAAREIIDLQLSVVALEVILSNYRDYLGKDEIAAAELLLSELNNTEK